MSSNLLDKISNFMGYTVLDWFLIVILLVGQLLVVYGTIVKNKWGINLRPVRCPRCRALAPKRHVPTSRPQKLWGGHTCYRCGCEFDKWGREVMNRRAGSRA